MPNPFKTTKCKGCPAQLVYARNIKTGKTVPIQIIPVIYELELEEDGSATCQPISNSKAMGINHFATCPDAQRFHR